MQRKKFQILLDVIMESESNGLRVNCQKKYVKFTSKKGKIPKCHVAVNKMQIEKVDRFKYLDSCITSEGRSDIALKRKIGQAEKAFIGMGNVVCARKTREIGNGK